MALTIPVKYRDGIVDATAIINSQLAKCRGKVLRFSEGRYRITGPVRTPADCDYEVQWDPGACFEAAPFDGNVFHITSHKDSHARYRNILRSPSIRGTLVPDPQGIGKQHGIVCVGGGGANGIAANGLSIYDARIERLSGHGIHFEHVYGANVYGAWVQWCGKGVHCNAANGTTFYGLSTKYNYVGYENIQALNGGIIEGNMTDGGRYSEVGTRYSVHDVWYEQNNLQNAEAGAADIWAGDPAGPWKPVVVSISGSTTFHNSYSTPGIDNRTVATHNISLNGYLVTSGAIRFFYPNQYFTIKACPGSYIMDNSATNAIKDMPNGVKGPVNYSRPGMVTIGQ
jgi:hypothetical protein